MKRVNKQRNRTHKLTIDKSIIKVSFEELFYDLIFVIVLGKISSIVALSEELSLVTIATSVILFCVFLFSWMIRLVHNNQVHVLSNKFGQKVVNLKRLTYLELVVILVLLHQYDTLTFSFFISIILIVLFVTILTVTEARTFIGQYFKDDRHKLLEIIAKARDRNTNIVNIDYICERYGVILILFLGEILTTTFSSISSTFKFLAVTIIILYLFNEVSNLLKYIPNYLERSENPEFKYISLKKYFINILLVLMFLILSLDYSNHHHISLNLILVGLVVIYMILTICIKRVFEYELDVFAIIYNLVFSTVVIVTPFELNKVNIVLLLIPFFWFGYQKIYNKKA